MATELLFYVMVLFFHLFSKGAESADLFVSDKELDDAVNRIAVVSFITGCMVLGYCVMDTHIHVLLFCPFDCALDFKHEYQKRTRDYLTRRRGDAALNTFVLEMLQIPDEDYLKRVGTYVICQATKDGKRVMQYDYRWSSAALYFRTVRNDLLWRLDAEGRMKRVEKITELAHQTQKQLFYSHRFLPENWEVCDGIILPSSFVDVATFEKIYKTHNAFRVFCCGSASKDEQILNNMAESVGVEMDENEAREKAAELSQRLFGRRVIRGMDVNKRIELARALRRLYKMSLSQISRRVSLPENVIREQVK